LELARMLARHDLELHLIDTRADQLTAERLSMLDDAVAQVHVHNVPVLPELVVGELPRGTHVVIMTHDHAEDAALCDAAIRKPDLATIGLIGSSAKWTRFQRKLAEDGNSPETIARITTPIGLADLPGKEPAVIAVSVAAWLLQRFTEQRSAAAQSSSGYSVSGQSDSMQSGSMQSGSMQSDSIQSDSMQSDSAQSAGRHPGSARTAVRRPTPAQREAQA
jgi:xanthine dehydrogenase accessory factor